MTLCPSTRTTIRSKFRIGFLLQVAGHLYPSRKLFAAVETNAAAHTSCSSSLKILQSKKADDLREQDGTGTIETRLVVMIQ